MICYNCGNQLPEESDFCPYCMIKFNEPPATPLIKLKKARNNKNIVIVLVSVIAVLIITAVILFFGQKDSEKKSIGDREKSSESTERVTNNNSNLPEESQTSSSSTTNPSPNTPSQDNQQVYKELMIDAYTSIIFEKVNTAGVFDLNFTYTVYDLNADGIFELIISIGNESKLNAEYCYTEVFTFKNNRVVSIGKFNNECFPTCEIYLAKDGGIILCCYSEYIAQIKMAGNKAEYTVLSTNYDDFEINDHVIEMMPQSSGMTYGDGYKTLVEEVINKGYDAVATKYLKDYAESCD